jgi:short-subunit dehydrogenase
MRSFDSCVALVTGASAGLGREFARQLAPRARVLILAARRENRLQELAAELARPGLEIRTHAVDLADPQQLEALIDALSAERIDLLVNNAGVGDHGLFEKSEWARVQGMLDTNIRALTRLTHALLPQLLRSHRGAILNVSSIAALIPVPRMAVYAATKAYVSSFTEGLRAELRGYGVTVTALLPGPIDTEFFVRAERPGVASGVVNSGFFKIPAWQAVHEALEAAEHGRARIISGWQVWAVMLLVSALPIALIRLFLPIAAARRRG